MFFKLSFLTLLFWATSASAAQMCPPGYIDKLQLDLEREVYVTFQGKTYQCLERKGGHNYTGSEHICSDRITVHQLQYVNLVSKEGLNFGFSAEHDRPITTRTKDCSSGSFCIERTQYTYQTRNPNASFTIPFTEVEYIKTPCEKYSF
jgi:hypothetical protein